MRRSISLICSTDNAIPIKSWFSDPHDIALLELLPLLDALRFTNDVRSVLSRNLHLHSLWWWHLTMARMWHAWIVIIFILKPYLFLYKYMYNDFSIFGAFSKLIMIIVHWDCLQDACLPVQVDLPMICTQNQNCWVSNYNDCMHTEASDKSIYQGPRSVWVFQEGI